MTTDPTPAGHRREAAPSLAERRPGQMVQVAPLPGEHWLAHALRAATINQTLLLGDMMRGEYR